MSDLTTPSAASAWEDVVRIRTMNPLVLNVTNNVVTNTTANALLSLGASPAMTHAPGDAAELAALAQAVVLNMGTPAQGYVDSMLAAGRAANAKGAPVAWDPVAAGATSHRRELATLLLSQVRVAVIRGNGSEIMHLAGQGAMSKGADSTHGSLEARDAARTLAERLGCVVCVSGEQDLVTDGQRLVVVRGGHPMMTKVTGLGCTATALIGAFLAVSPDPLTATAHAMRVMSAAGGLAASRAKGPGSLQLEFYDALYNLTLDDLATWSGLEVAP